MQARWRSGCQPSSSHSVKGGRLGWKYHGSGARVCASQRQKIVIEHQPQGTNPVAAFLESVQAAISPPQDPVKALLQRWKDLSSGSVPVTGQGVKGNERSAAESTEATASETSTSTTTTSTSSLPGKDATDDVQHPDEEPAAPSGQSQEPNKSSAVIVTTHKSIFEVRVPQIHMPCCIC